MAFTQGNGVVEGLVRDSRTGNPLPGAHIFLQDGKGTLSDIDGKYSLALPEGTYSINAQFIGYVKYSRKINIRINEKSILNIDMMEAFEILDEVVVSAEKTEQRATDVNVSMAILKPDKIEMIASSSLDMALTKIPGFEILDGQPSIRGGSGFSYGAGSRVLVLVDDLPMISADAGHIHWSFLPLENLAQVEIIKGASSVLYGSSALNGVVNLRYKSPVDKPSSSIRVFSGAYLSPKRTELIWWDSPRWFAGASASHSRKIGNIDITASTYVFKDKGYREDEYSNTARLNTKVKYRSKKVRGLSYGLGASGMMLNQGDFFLWENADSGAYKQNPAGTSFLNGYRVFIDPSIKYFTRKNNKHSLITRYYRNVNEMPDNEDKNSQYNMILGEYSYQHNFSNNINWTIGSSFNFSQVHSNLYGDHSKNETAIFTQASATLLTRIKYNLGFRWETYKLNDVREYSHPVFRTGLNYQLLQHTFLRMSLGQGYRFPSIAEKFTATQVGALNVFPNPDLESETAWSADAGIIQAYQFGSLKGYADLSVFRSEYTNMIEFTFDLYLPDANTSPSLDYVGFKALNVGKARITGAEVVLNAEQSIGQLTVGIQGGYTYIYPIDLSISEDSTVTNILKYRHRHSIKGDLYLSWRRCTLGVSAIHNSLMERVDDVFINPLFGNLILPGYPDYFNENRKGYTTVDLRLSCDITKETTLSVIGKNILNVEYLGRPGDIQPHRNIMMQFLMKF